MSGYSGVSPKDPNNYIGARDGLVPAVTRNRRPTTADYRQPETGKNYPITCIWQVGKNPTTGQMGELWFLSKIVANQATWVNLGSGGVDGITSITADNSVQVFADGGGNVDAEGIIVANGTNAKPLYVKGTEADPIHLLDFELQVASAVSPTPANTNSCGISCYNTNQFSIDATSGMVSLAGGGVNPPVLQFMLDDGQNATADGSGIVDMDGETVANSLNSKPLFTKRTPGTNDVVHQIQLTSVTTNAAKNINKAGIGSFNSAQFQVDSATGFLSLAGSTSLAPILTLTGSSGGGAIGPDGTGDVDLVAGTGMTITGSGNAITFTASGITWREETGTSSNFASAGEGIFANNASTVTLTLPASPSIGYTYAAYQEGAGKVKIQLQAGDIIRFGNQVTSSGGYIQSLNQGDAVYIVAIDGSRFRVINSIGSWTLA